MFLIVARIAVAELLYMDDIPTSVSINEAINLAKKYGDDKSYSFGYVRDFMCEHEMGEVMIFGGTDVLSKKLENGIVLLVSE